MSCEQRKLCKRRFLEFFKIKKNSCIEILYSRIGILYNKLDFTAIPSSNFHYRMRGMDAVKHVQDWVIDYSQWLAPHNHIIVITK